MYPPTFHHLLAWHPHTHRSFIYPNEAGPLNLHISMFLPMLRYQCDQQQTEKWLGMAERFEIIGTYVQTELGHG